MANEEAENDTVLKHLSLQRDELLEHYVRKPLVSFACYLDAVVSVTRANAK